MGIRWNAPAFNKASTGFGIAHPSTTERHGLGAISPAAIRDARYRADIARISSIGTARNLRAASAPVSRTPSSAASSTP